MLSTEEVARYSRHLMIEDVGPEGQERFKKAKVLIVGAGALASPNILYLAGAGIGTIGIVDDDCVDISNLHRQVAFDTHDIGKPKVQCAQEKIHAINPDINVKTHLVRMDSENASSLVLDYDLIIDATDNFVSKFLINDACVLADKPFIHAGIMRHCGQILGVMPHQSACLSCIFPTPPQNTSLYKNGLFGTLTGVLGAISANEVLKFFSGVGKMLFDSLLSVDLASMQFSKIKIKPNPTCPICGKLSSRGIRKIQCD